MATGDQADLVARQKTVLPPRWFQGPDSSGNSQIPVLDTLLNGFAAVGAWLYSLLQYVRNQTRLSTSADGWLELAALDYYGPGEFPRKAGESDPDYAARIEANLLPKANTRANIQNALEDLTGYPVRMIEPFDPRDNAMLDVSFLDVDSIAYPGNLSDGARHYNGLARCVLPATAQLGNNPSQFFLDAQFLDAGFIWDGTTATLGGAAEVYGLLTKLKVFGTKIWVLFVPIPGSENPFILGESTLGGPDVLT